MRNLAEDREEMADDAGRRFVQRARCTRGIRPDEPSCWFVDIEQEWLDPRAFDSDTVWLGCSPGDAVSFLDGLASSGRRVGVGYATLEVFGDGVNGPTVARVYPRLDESCPSCGKEVAP